MIVEKVLKDPRELMSIIDGWSKEGERKKSISSFAGNSYDDEMTMEEVVKEVHKNRRSEKQISQPVP
jgi:hypothetical protein